MRLAICDDNDLERNLLYSLLKKYFLETSVRCEFTLYDRGANLYYDVMENIEYDIIFLDPPYNSQLIEKTVEKVFTGAKLYFVLFQPIMHLRAIMYMRPGTY